MARSKSTKKKSAKAAATGKPRAAADHAAAPVWRPILWLVAGVAMAFVLASLISYDPADPPGHAAMPHNEPVANWCGVAGAALAHYLFFVLGSGVWVLVAGVIVAAAAGALRRPVDQPGLRAVGLLLLALSFSAFHALYWPDAAAFPEGAGGLIAILGVERLTASFSTLGATLWIILLGAVGAILAFDRWLVIIPAAIWQTVRPALGRTAAATRDLASRGAARAAERRLARMRDNDIDDDDRLERPERTARESRARRKAKAEPIGEEMGGLGATDAFDPEEAGEKESRREKRRKAKAAAAAAEEAECDDENEEWDEEDGYEDDGEYEYEDDEEYEDEDEDAVPGAPQVFDPEALRRKIAKLPVRFAGVDRSIATDDDMRGLQDSDQDLEGYQFPGLDLLEDPEDNYSEKLESFVRSQASALEEALGMYKIEGEVVAIDSGPVITLYEVKLAPGTKVSRLQAVSSDLARALKAVNIRIVSNMQGRDTVGIEVPNAEKEKVRLKELMSHASRGPRADKMRLPMFLGKDAHGDPLIEDLTQMPHMLIAGTTGSGKSVCLNTIIISFLYTKKPNELKLVLIDPKMVELSQYRDIPHLMCPVVTEMSKACAILEWAVTKMDERYELLAESGCRDIASYNELEWEELRDRFDPQNEIEEARIPRKLPYIVFVIDELADLMMTQKEVEGSIVRIAQKARAVGIHLVLATQRPQANVVTGLIKSNMPGRISFKVASGMDSRIVLDQKGGELLLGQGDMLFLSPRSHKLMRSQGTLVEDRETRRVVRYLKEVAAPNFERQLIQIGQDGDAGEEAIERSLQTAQEDPLFDKAVEVVIESKRGSVSLLQRRLSIGYTRAARLIEMMGEAGIIGAYKGTVSREVQITSEEWEAMKEQAARDAEAARSPGAPAKSAPVEQASLFENDKRTELASEAHVAVNGALDDDDDDTSDHRDDARSIRPRDDDEDEPDTEEDEEDVVEEDEEDFDEDDDEAEEEEDDDGEEDEEWEYEYVDDDDEAGDEDEEEDEDEDGEWEYEDDEEEDDEEYEDEDEDGDEEEDDEEDEDEEEDESVAEVRTVPFKPNVRKSG